MAKPINPNKVKVKPYTKSDGTKVPGHIRTAPNKSKDDNISAHPKKSK